MLILKDRYPGQTDTGDPDFPHGKARNATTLNDGTGFPLERDWVNDLLGAKQALVEAAGLTPNETPDRVGASQELQALDVLFYRKSVIDAIDATVSAIDAALTTAENELDVIISSLNTAGSASNLSGISAVNTSTETIIWQRVRQYISASAFFSVTNSASGAKSFEFTLPGMVGNFNSGFQCIGAGAVYATAAAHEGVHVSAVNGTDRMLVEWYSTRDSGSESLRVSFHYYVGV